MQRPEKLLICLGILLFVLLNYPLLQIFNDNRPVAGIPLLILFLFAVWIGAIFGLRQFARRFLRESPTDKGKE